MEKRKRRSFSKAYKAEVVGLARKSGKSIGAVAKELDLTETALRKWVSQAEVDSGRGPAGALTTAEREELGQLRRRVKTLEMEREILKKATAFFAKESK
jgi:transposase